LCKPFSRPNSARTEDFGDAGADSVTGHLSFGIPARPLELGIVCVELFRHVQYCFAMRQVIIYPGDDGFWVAECPSLPGCVSQGESRESAIMNIREAIEGYVLALQDDGMEVPEDHFEALLLAV
jgi:predicted RNase H-like HicB family nuclease